MIKHAEIKARQRARHKAKGDVWIGRWAHKDDAPKIKALASKLAEKRKKENE